MENSLAIIDHENHSVSPNDTRKYRHITIPSNNIQIMLVSDATTDKSAACVDVHVGSMSDLPVAAGIAHFLEHMLFMGTKTYPDENAYQAFLSSHGGSSNAYTDQENTVYYFDVLPDHFDKALDIFSSFFVCPLFNESSTFREINAVDSENSKNLQSDTWRSYQLAKSMAKASHPYSYFGTGSLKTLKDNTEANGLSIRDLLLEFYDKYYSANLMKVCVYGKEDLDTLQKMVVERFSKVPNKNSPRPSFPSDPYGPDELSKLVKMIPIRDSKTLDLEFILPPIWEFYESKPEKYLSHLLGHESEGSILSALKKRGWANSLSSGVSQSYKDFSFLSLEIDLSEEGSNHVNDVVACVFAYIGMLKRIGVQEWIASEIKVVGDLRYRFLQKTQPTSYVMKLANNMQTFKPEHTVSSGYIVEKVDISMIPALLDRLTPENMIILYKKKGLATTKKEFWYGTDYEDEKFSGEVIESWNRALNEEESSWVGDLRLPTQNPFIPTDFKIRADDQNASEVENNVVLLKRLCEGQLFDGSIYSNAAKSAVTEALTAVSKAPVECEDSEEVDEDGDEETAGESGDSKALMDIYSGKLLQTWFKLDKQWKVPLLNVILILESNIATSTPAGFTLTDMMAQILKEALNEFAYYADCAGLHYDIQLAKGGLEFLFFGYQDKLAVLVLKSLEELKTLVEARSDGPSIGEKFFDRLKEKVLRSYYNSKFSQPYNHAVLGSSLCLEEPRWSNADKQRALLHLDFNDFRSFVKQFSRSLKVNAFIHGNYSVKEAEGLSESILKVLGSLPLSTAQDPIRRVVKLEEGVHYIYRQHAKHFNVAEVNSSIDTVFLCEKVAGSGYDGLADFMLEIHSEAILNLLVQMMADKAFDQLRTKEQLGYIVFTGIKKLGQHTGLQIVVQSNHKDPKYLDDRVESFLSSFFGDLTEPPVSPETPVEDSPVCGTYISDEAIDEFKQSTIEKLLEQPKNLSEETKDLMEEIRLNTYFFQRNRVLADYLKGPEVGTRSQLILFFKKYVLDATTRRKFSSHFYGGACLIEESIGRVIEDPSMFKRSMPLLPAVSYDHAFKSLL